MRKRIGLNAFNMTAAGHQSSGMWRHPDSQAHRYKDLDHWLDLACTLERGRFDALFLADVLGPYDVYGGSARTALENGMQIPANDPFQYVSAMASVTERLGFALTASATFEHPYPLARRFSTLDHLHQGPRGMERGDLVPAKRVAQLRHEPLPHDERYEMAEEFMTVMYKLWERSWADGAVVLDREGGVFVDPDKVHPIRHRGRYFDIDGVQHGRAVTAEDPRHLPGRCVFPGTPLRAEHAEGLFVNVLNSQLSKVITDDIRTQVEPAAAAATT